MDRLPLQRIDPSRLVVPRSTINFLARLGISPDQLPQGEHRVSANWDEMLHFEPGVLEDDEEIINIDRSALEEELRQAYVGWVEYPTLSLQK